MEDPAAAPAVNPVSPPLVDANLVFLSSGSKDEVDWEALASEDDEVESVGSWSPSTI
jgi:hypothetical protein